MIDQSLLKGLMSKFGLDRLSPTQLLALFQLKGKRSDEITKGDLTKVIQDLFNVELSDERATQLIDLVQSGEAMNLLDWIVATGNQDVVLDLIKQSKVVEPFVQLCPFCESPHEVSDELVSFAEQPGDEPVLNQCPICLGVYELPDLSQAA